MTKNTQQPDFTVVIPARYASTRLPGKPLTDIVGQTMIERVCLRAQQSNAERVIVATDDERISEAVLSFGGEAVMTDVSHQSGTDRIQQVAAELSLSNDHIVVNVQGDEPFIDPKVINQVADNLHANSWAGMSTLSEKIVEANDIDNANIVKVVSDNFGKALYFSRSTIPYIRDRSTSELTQSSYFRHIGIYAYRVSTLNSFVKWPMSTLENLEKLEQLRALENGIAIHCEPACAETYIGIDTPEDLEKARKYVAGN